MTTPTTIPHDPAELLTEWPGEGVRVQIVDDSFATFGVPPGSFGMTTADPWAVRFHMRGTWMGCRKHIRLAPATPQPSTPSRLPPEALASMPTGLKAAPWIVEGVPLPINHSTDDPFLRLALDKIREHDARTLEERATNAARAMREALDGVLRGGTGSDAV